MFQNVISQFALCHHLYLFVEIETTPQNGEQLISLSLTVPTLRASGLELNCAIYCMHNIDHDIINNDDMTCSNDRLFHAHVRSFLKNVISRDIWYGQCTFTTVIQFRNILV